jgi:hypothetical protein
MFNYPKKSAEDIANEIDDALDTNKPFDTAVIEDAYTHILVLLNENSKLKDTLEQIKLLVKG